MNIFPNRLYRFVYSNFDVLPPEKLARYLGCRKKDVVALLEDLNLPELPLPPFERALPLVIRRNWFLIPAKDIASLIGYDKTEFARVLLDMDFLDIKLGPGRPVRPIRWKAPTSSERARARKLSEKLRRRFKDAGKWQAPFSFVKEISRPPKNFDLRNCRKAQTLWNPMINYSYVGTHGDVLYTGEDFFPHGVLARLAERGVNAVWLPAILHDLSPCSHFSEFGKGHETRIKNLRKMAKKALRYGIGIYLYLNEPRGMQAEFFERHPDVRGMRSRIKVNPVWGLCTSTRKVQDFLRDSARFVFGRIPELAGAILITASENMTNCYSHGFQDEIQAADAPPPQIFCPRCQARGPARVITDAARLISEGVKDSRTDAEIIQWLWSWHFVMSPEQVAEGIRLLPPEVAVMIDWARGTPFERFGKKAVVEEYSLAFVAPSSRSKMMVRAARSQKRKVLARVQISTSVEMNAMPYLPVLPNIARLIREMRKHKVDGVLGSWIFGAYPSRNLELVSLEKKKNPLQNLAQKYYGRKGAPFAIRAWKTFSKGLDYLPESQSVLYFSPLQCGPGVVLQDKSEPGKARMVLLFTNDLEIATSPFGPVVCAKSFRHTADCWRHGILHLKKAVELSPQKHRAENERDLGVSTGCGVHFRSAANHIEFLHLFSSAASGKKSFAAVRKRLLEIIDDEYENVETLLPIAGGDSRIGFEGSIGYFYRPTELIEKLIGLEKLRRRVSAK